MKNLSLPWIIAALVIALIAVHVALALLSRKLVREAEQHHPPIGQFTGTTGERVHYLDSGPREGLPIVLVHGASTSLLDFETSLRPRLDDEFRVIAVDRPGSGWSETRAAALGDPARQADAIVEVLDALGIERALWVGHSWGGTLVLAALLEHPERAYGGVAIAAPTQPWQEPLPFLIRLLATPVIGPLLAACWVMPLGQRVLDKAIADSFRPEPPPGDLDAYLARTGATLTVRPASFRATARDLVGLNHALADLAPR